MEINNTDAEGRLVLADGVAFASGGELGAVDDIIDIATLTGAQMVATGRFFAGIVSDSETMETECVRAGKVRPRGFHQIHPTVSSPWSSTLRP
jgi:probable aminopeptidase NPEPL1